MLWNVQAHDSGRPDGGGGFAKALKRDEVIAALEHRVEQIAASGRATEFATEGIEHSPGTPATGRSTSA